MKLIFTFLAAVIFLTGSAVAQNNNTVSPIDTVNYSLSGFTGLRLQGPFDVKIKQGEAEAVRIEVPDEVKNRIEAKVDDDGTLQIRNKHDNWGWGVKSWYSDKGYWHHHREKIKVYITAKTLEKIIISGSGTVALQDDLSGKKLRLRIRGSGELNGKIAVAQLDSKISGSGKIKLSGTAEKSHIKVRGSGAFAGRELVTTVSSVHISGSGHAQINASDQVDATLHGSAGVSYTGTAKIKTSKSGSAEISKF